MAVYNGVNPIHACMHISEPRLVSTEQAALPHRAVPPAPSRPCRCRRWPRRTSRPRLAAPSQTPCVAS
eukprot:366090-Chlamydomonas_euryale.AAC.5